MFRITRSHRLQATSTAVVVAALLGALAGAPIAAAHDHRIPRAVLETNGARQEGAMVRSSWTSPAGPQMCVHQDSDGFGYPEAVGHEPGAQVRIRLMKSQRPGEIVLRAYRATDIFGNALGPAEDIDYTLERHRRAGSTVAWDLVFTPTVIGDLYIQTIVYWPTQGRCGSDDQHVWWNFHLASP